MEEEFYSNQGDWDGHDGSLVGRKVQSDGRYGTNNATVNKSWKLRGSHIHTHPYTQLSKS